MPDITGVHHIGLTVSNLDRSVPWYTQVFGVTQLVAFEEAGGERRKVLLRHPRTGLVIGLVAHRSSPDRGFDETHMGLDHLSFAVANRDELVAWQHKLQQLGIDPSPIAEARGGSEVLVFRDPDNIQLELIASRPA